MAASIKVSEISHAPELKPDDLFVIADMSEGKSHKLRYGFLEDQLLANIKEQINDLVALSGAGTGATGVGEMTGDIVSNGATIRTALQQLEVGVENLQATVAQNRDIHRLSGPTIADPEPTSYSFVVVDKATGDLRVIDKNFLELIPGV